MKITYLPHALRRMDERRIAQWEVAAVLEAPAVEYPGHVFERVVAERVLPGRRQAVKVLYTIWARKTSGSSSPWSWADPRATDATRRSRKEVSNVLQVRVRP
jgi:hypothetical protein